MQIGSTNPLRYLSGQGQAPRADDAGPDVAALAAQPEPPAPLPTDAAAAPDDGVLLSLRSTNGVAQAASLVYSARTLSPAPSDTEADTERMAARYREAMARAAGSTALRLDTQGVLVAEPASAAEIKAQQFMHFAVNTMREYADAQERAKLQAAQQASGQGLAGVAAVIPRGLAEMQKLAARFGLSS